MTTNNLTCVYTIHDQDVFETERTAINEKFKSSEGEPWAITAISGGHELHRVSLLEDAHNESRYDLFDEIFGMVDPLEAEDISKLEGY